MTAALDDDGVFVRSLASRGYLGGLSPAAVRVIDALDAAGFDLILLETVGTGQSEMDVAEVADVRVVISAPGLGDDIQAMKSGLLEIADVLVVNKGDREGAGAHAAAAHGRALHPLAALRRVPRSQDHCHDRPGCAGAGHDGVRVWEARASAEGALGRRRRRARYLIARAAADLVAAARASRKEPARSWKRLADDVLSGRITPDQAARSLLSTLATASDRPWQPRRLQLRRLCGRRCRLQHFQCTGQHRIDERGRDLLERSPSLASQTRPCRADTVRRLALWDGKTRIVAAEAEQHSADGTDHSKARPVFGGIESQASRHRAAGASASCRSSRRSRSQQMATDSCP